MKVKTAESAALIVALTMSLFSIGGALVDFVFAGAAWEWYYLSYAMGVFFGGYYISRFVIRKFIIYRIKPLYQIALSRDIKTRELESQLINKDDVLEDIGKSVTDWAEANREEIEHLKRNELYRRDFIGNISHELKTPIFNIQGYVNTLLDGGLEDENINREYLERAEKNVERLANIVKDLEDITKLESGTVQLQKEAFDIVTLAEYIAATVGYEAEEKDITVIVDKKVVRPVMVFADKRYIEQILVNLLINSIRYGKQGGTSYITFVDMFDKIMVESSDNGIGIAEENIPHIFERFYRIDRSRSRSLGGSGLGLAIVKHIINAHDEGITVRSEPGRGTTFSFTLAKPPVEETPEIPTRK